MREATIDAVDKTILGLLADGLTTQQVATALHLTHETSKTYIKIVVTKMNARNRAQAVAHALREKLIT